MHNEHDLEPISGYASYPGPHNPSDRVLAELLVLLILLGSAKLIVRLASLNLERRHAERPLLPIPAVTSKKKMPA
jgi:hypothetical protein